MAAHARSEMSTETVERTAATDDAAPVRKKKSRKFSPWGIVAWLVGLGFFFPVLWIIGAFMKPPETAAAL